MPKFQANCAIIIKQILYLGANSNELWIVTFLDSIFHSPPVYKIKAQVNCPLQLPSYPPYSETPALSWLSLLELKSLRILVCISQQRCNRKSPSPSKSIKARTPCFDSSHNKQDILGRAQNK
ncbi:unnamed protein product [Cuscuta epithymum]|uniref:Uncharacterized protein n=1 Tax=Cuscuta epithymum TaxID=186058 RepID=A0AAV0ET94_9ASTE|nr:unnamed protein product [Cuscuta epithymum]